MDREFIALSRGQLETTLGAGPPDNEARSEGYALVNVLDAQQFRRERIPDSIHIPLDRIDEFERRFARDKKIVVYSDSFECTASETVARELAERGFEHVFEYAGGVRDWQEGRNAIAGDRAQEGPA